jgi:hypothetical protein
MSKSVLTTKPIPEKQKRRSTELPCDGVKRFTVGKAKDLTYSEAYAAISTDITLEVKEDGGRVYKHGGVLRLCNLNKVYFGQAQSFIVSKLEEQKTNLKAAVERVKAKKAKTETAAPDATPETTPVPSPGPAAENAAPATDGGKAATPEEALKLAAEAVLDDSSGHLNVVLDATVAVAKRSPAGAWTLTRSGTEAKQTRHKTTSALVKALNNEFGAFPAWSVHALTK